MCVCVASPASGKLGLRMTTLHEEPPSSRHPLNEDVEENYSDSELNQYDDTAVRKPPLKSRFPTSKTMGSLRDIGSSYQSMCSSVNATNNVTTTTTMSKNVRKSAVNAQNKQINQGTPSMTSSTSSGYGSQVNVPINFKLIPLSSMFDARCFMVPMARIFFNVEKMQ